MSDLVALRMETDFLQKLDKLGREDKVDRSTLMRQLVQRGYQEYLKEKAFQQYKEGKVTFSEAAHRACLTLWEMEQYCVEKGWKSAYDLIDLKEEMQVLARVKSQ